MQTLEAASDIQYANRFLFKKRFEMHSILKMFVSPFVAIIIYVLRVVFKIFYRSSPKTKVWVPYLKLTPSMKLALKTLKSSAIFQTLCVTFGLVSFVPSV